LDYTAQFIELASTINSSMPQHVVEKIAAALNDAEKSVKGSRILVLGVAYKRDVSDTRESPAVDIIGLLKKRGARLSYADPFVPALELLGETMPAFDLEQGVQGFDLVVIVTDHSAFDYARILSEASLVFDTRNATAGTPCPATCRLVKL